MRLSTSWYAELRAAKRLLGLGFSAIFKPLNSIYRANFLRTKTPQHSQFTDTSRTALFAMASSPDSLFEACHFVSEREYKKVESTEKCSKRASVAIVIAFHIPSSGNSPSSSWINVKPGSPRSEQESKELTRTATTLEELEERNWIEEAVPHVLFIKRSAREADRWSNHVALPGGKREADETDVEAARRETEEEVGIALTSDNSIFVGGLDQRMVTTSFGTRELLVLSPYIWIMTRPGLPLPCAQESEVHSAHWVPISNLLDPTSRATERVEISSRLARSYAKGSFFAFCVRMVTGQMLFSAISMTATQSVMAVSDSASATFTESEATTTATSPDVLAVGQEDLQVEGTSDRGASSSASNDVAKHDTEQQPELIMWGLTLSVLTDFLDLLPPHNAIALWSYPTFSAPDLAVILAWLNRGHKTKTNDTVSVRATRRRARPASERAQMRHQARIERRLARAERKKEAGEAYAETVVHAIGEDGEMDYVGVAMLDFYAKIRTAIGLTIGFRCGVLGIGLIGAASYYRRYRTSR